MRKSKNGQAGFSLLEVLLAVVILGVGVLGAVSMQTSSFRSTGDAARMERAMTIARTELDYQRGLNAATRLTGTRSCQSGTDSAISCSVTVTACTIDAPTGTLTCPVTGTSNIDRVSVTVTWRPGKTLTIQGLVAAR